VVESCLSWLQRNRRLARRYERKAEHFPSVADLGCALLTHRRLNACGTGRRYYSCFVHKQQEPRHVPPGHPPTVNLPEPNLHETLTQWLGHALFGPDRVDYWRRCLHATATKTNANKISIPERLAELDAEITDLERRLTRRRSCGPNPTNDHRASKTSKAHFNGCPTSANSSATYPSEPSGGSTTR
jgi:hypothetical protein